MFKFPTIDFKFPTIACSNFLFHWPELFKFSFFRCAKCSNFRLVVDFKAFSRFKKISISYLFPASRKQIVSLFLFFSKTRKDKSIMYDESDYQYMQEFKKRYGGKFRLGRDKSVEGVTIGYYIESNFKPHRRAEAGEFPWGCWQFDNGELAGLAPMRTATKIRERFPWVRLHLKSDDGDVLTFPADRLPELADALKLRRRRRMTEEQKKTAADRLREFQFTPRVTVD